MKKINLGQRVPFLAEKGMLWKSLGFIEGLLWRGQTMKGF
jgi:hypothetical protein